jgi:CO/xanthine dehydrogenase FAD-binding subunit
VNFAVCPVDGNAMSPFVYHRPATLDEARDALGRDGARALAGGTDLIPQLREGRREAGHLVDLKAVPECAEFTARGDGALSLGAAVPVAYIAARPEVTVRYQAIADASGMIGSVQVQNRATLGGNICNGAPSADTVPALVACGAMTTIAGPSGKRTMALESLLAGPGRVNLQAGEFLVSVTLPPGNDRAASAYIRFTPRREMDIAIVGAAAYIALDAAGHVAEARIALASVAPTVILARSAEAALGGTTLTGDAIAAAADAAVQDASPISDTRASADFRRELIAVLSRRALERCRARLA